MAQTLYPRKDPETPEERTDRLHKAEMQALADLIASHVGQVIVRPDHYDHIKGHYLYASFFRVNVWSWRDNGQGSRDVYVRASYFLDADVIKNEAGDREVLVYSADPSLPLKKAA